MKKRVVSLILSAALCLLNTGSAFSAGALTAYAQEDLWEGVYPVPEGERIPEADAPAVTTLQPKDPSQTFGVVGSDVIPLDAGDLTPRPGSAETTLRNFKDPSQVVTDATGGGAVGYYDDRPSATADPSETYIPQNAGTTTTTPAASEPHKTVASGKAGAEGSDLTWVLDDDGTMTISGTGTMNLNSWVQSHSLHDQLKKVVIEDGIINISMQAFQGCENLVSVSLPGSLRRIDMLAFAYCPKLSDIQLPEGLEEIGATAFDSCRSLTEITVPESVTLIDSSAFQRCDSLTDVTILNEACEIAQVDATLNGATTVIHGYPGSTAQAYAELTHRSFEQIKELANGECGAQGKNVVWRLYETGLLTISGKGEMKGYSSENLAPWRSYPEQMKKVTIQDGVTSIGDYAFSHCSDLTSITIPDDVTSIGYNAFSGCSGLTSITIPDSVTSIGNSAFCDCTELTNITLPTGIMTIGTHMFYNCSSLEGIIIPNSVTNINYGAFSNCRNLKSIILPDSVTEIGKYAFCLCDKITDIAIPNGVRNIGEYAFQQCTELKSVSISKSVATISSDAFWHCSKLEAFDVSSDNSSFSSLDGILFNKDQTELRCFPPNKADTSYSIPKSVTSVGDFAFCGCEKLSGIKLPDTLTSIGYMSFAGCINLKNITLTSRIVSIKERAFWGCWSIQRITIPDGVTRIAHESFRNCTALRIVAIPGSVVNIESWAFYECNTNLILEGYTGSCAETYAKDNGIAFKSIGTVATTVSAVTTVTTVTSTVTQTNTKDINAGLNGTDVSTNGSEAYIGSEVPNTSIEITPRFTTTSTVPPAPGTSPTSPTGETGETATGTPGTTNTEPDPVYKEEFILYLPLYGHQVYETVAEIVNVSVSDPNVAVYVVSESKNAITVQAVREGRCKLVVTLANGDVYAVNLTVGDAGTTTTKPVTSTVPVTTVPVTTVLTTTEPGLTPVSGVCGAQGNNLSWTLDAEGTLTISGSGQMKYYSTSGDVPGKAPWYEYRDRIKAVSVGDGVTSIGTAAFYGLTEMEKITLPETLTNIYSDAFVQCKKLESLVLPDGVRTLYSLSFRGCESLRSVRLGKSFQIGYSGSGVDSVFSGCSALEEITVSEENTEFSSADGVLLRENEGTELYFCPPGKTGDFVIPDGVTKFAERAFYMCDKLTSVTIPDGMEIDLDTAIISGCTALERVYIGDNVSRVAPYFVKGCPHLKEIAVSADNPNYCSRNGLLFNRNMTSLLNYPAGKSWTHYEVPEGVRSIGETAFEGCSLKTIILPDSLTSLGEYAFANSFELESITIPEKVSEIRQQTFMDCQNLKTVTILNPLCEIYDDWETLHCYESIRSYAGSTAEEYANRYGIPFEALDAGATTTVTVTTTAVTSAATTTTSTTTTTMFTTTVPVTTAAVMTTVRAFVFPDDAWSIESDSSIFYRENENHELERFLTPDDRNKLEDRTVFTDKDWKRINGISAHIKEHGNGTCYGMSLLAIMNLIEMFSPSDIAASAGTLSELLDTDDNVISAINYHQLLQYREACQEALYPRLSNAKLMDDLFAVLDEGKPAFVIMSNQHDNSLQRHAVVAIGYEPFPISWKLWGEKKAFDGYIRLYDPAEPNEEVKMYINRQDHEWYIGKYPECASWRPNITLRAVFSDLEDLTYGSLFVDPDTGGSKSEKKATTQMTFDTKGDYNKPEWIDPNPGGSVGAANPNSGIVTEREMFDINGVSIRNMKNYVMEYDTDSYKFSVNDEDGAAAKVEMEYSDKLFYIQSDAMYDAVFSPDGMTAKLNNAPYSLHTVQNLAPDAKGFYMLSVTGGSANSPEFRQLSKDSWILSADKPLGTLEISAESRTGEVQKKVLTASKKICIYAASDGEIGVLYDFGKVGTTPESKAEDAEKGDVNFDGIISVEDAQLALKQYTASVAGNPSVLPDENQSKMDVNGDGDLSVDDAQYILMYYTQKVVSQKDITWDDLLNRNK